MYDDDDDDDGSVPPHSEYKDVDLETFISKTKAPGPERNNFSFGDTCENQPPQLVASSGITEQSVRT
jgi:hypothetical protein